MDWSAIFLGAVEGITEFLPVSSTGHLLIVEHWLGHRSDTFNVVIQAGAMLAVTIIYRRRLADLLKGWRMAQNRLYVAKLVVAFTTSVVLGLIAKKLRLTLPETVEPVAWALITGGVWIVIAEWYSARQADCAEVSWAVAVAVGIAQIIAAVFPGTSRSGATIFTAILLGTNNRPAATEFAFLVRIPTMFAASVYQLHGELRASESHEDWMAMVMGFVAAFFTAFGAVKWLLAYIQSHRFTLFAIYRILLGGALLLLLG
jgi:undecaprenyl-diphosphatase